jgi:hypothetical protein
MKVMKKVILASVLGVVAVGTVNAAADVTACTGTAGNGTAPTAAATNFIKVSFTPKCSANTYVFGQDSATYYRTGAVSTKGANAFAGSTNGGGVAATACGGTSCVASDATSAMNSAATS